MRIAQYINSVDDGGAETIVLELARMMSEAKIDNCIIHHGNEHIVERAHFTPCFKIDPFPIRSALKYGELMKIWLQQNGVGLLHSHLYGATLRGALAARMANIPHIATQHDTYTLLEKPSRVRWLRAASALGTHIVTISREMERTYQQCNKKYAYFPFPEDKFSMIYNGVDTDKFFSSTRTTSPFFRLISVGRIEDVKNYGLLLQALKYLKHKHNVNNVRLTLVGDGSQRADLEEYANTFIPGVVDFLGQRDDIPELLRKADMFVLPSKTEGLSCSILEAMASGLPILASNVGGNYELVERRTSSSFSNGDLFESGNFVELAEKIAFYTRQFDLNGLRQRSIQLVNRNFSLETMFNQYLKLYMQHLQLDLAPTLGV